MSETSKTSKEAFKLYKRWEQALLANHPKLPKGCTRIGFIAYCLAMAIHGTNGLDCFASDARIAGELEVYHRDTVTKYRHLAIELGWLVPNGQRHRAYRGTGYRDTLR